ncbi:uncharacterized protein TNCV_4478931 [Trichonephila clavipes]|nr:uncharacterized protein TNCV_4478931 [Trichonephila clavipes]
MVTQQKLNVFGWEVFGHPPSSPDIAPSDYYLFRSLQNYLTEKKFESFESVSKAVADYFYSKDENFYRIGIYMLPEGWQQRFGIGGERENDIEELILGHEDELTIEELQEILNEEHQGTQRNVSPEQEEDKRGPMPTFAIKDLFKKWEAVRAMVLEWHPNQADVSRVGDLYNDNVINYFRKILKKREKQSTLDMFFNAS